jgi:hypothetical protein
MNVCTGIKRLNTRYDDWSSRRLRISKLRWMGLEREAERLNALGEAAPVITLPSETD